jgi:hypothetical protein
VYITLQEINPSFEGSMRRRIILHRNAAWILSAVLLASPGLFSSSISQSRQQEIMEKMASLGPQLSDCYGANKIKTDGKIDITLPSTWSRGEDVCCSLGALIQKLIYSQQAF